jgi:FMN-dependent NADH-azoreductase
MTLEAKMEILAYKDTDRKEMFMLLLNIQSSPRGAKSASIAVTNAFLDAYRALHSDATIDTLNVWEENLPDFDQEAIGAKYKGVNKEPMDPAETAVWDKIQELAVRFQQATRIVLGVPMWNFAYPYKLKQLIDLVCQRHMLFTYDGKEYGPLLKTPRAFVVYARGGTYAEDSPTPASRLDHQKGYIDFWLKFIGVKEVHTLVVEGTTWGGKEKGEETIARGQEEATKLAADF